MVMVKIVEGFRIKMNTLKNNINRFRFIRMAGFYFLIPVSAIMLLCGCGENNNIIPASRLTSGQVTLSWNDVPQAVVYNIHLSTTPGVTALNAFKISDVTSPITITDLEPDTTYYFIVIAVDEAGQAEKSREVAYTVTPSPGNIHFNDFVTPLLPEQKPAAEKAVTVPAAAVKSKDAQKQSTPKQPAPTVGYGKVTLTWDNVSNATSYNIYWSNKKGVTKHNGTKISNVKNPHTVTGLEKGSTYYFVVTAVNESGESAVSESISYTVGEKSGEK
jgi:fibronectin type 3 domain-containing protein